MSDIPLDDWAGADGERWLSHVDRFESMIAPVGAALIARAGFRAGQRVCDIGCGGGATSLEIARRVGAEGAVVGVDISAGLVDEARSRATRSGLGNAEFVLGDAETGEAPGAAFDRLFSRFGVMFFRDSRAAFANMRCWLRPGGEFVFACWAAPDQNPWTSLVTEVAARHIDLPRREGDAPGPFRFADPEATRTMLEGAGYGDIALELWRGVQALGGVGAGPEQAASFMLEATSIGAAIEKQAPGLREGLVSELAEAFRPHLRDGSVWLEGAAWLVSARNPG